MPRFEITSPDGKRFEITAPEGATQDEVMSYARQQWKAPQTPQAPQAPQAPEQRAAPGSEELPGWQERLGNMGGAALEGMRTGGPFNVMPNVLKEAGTQMQQGLDRAAYKAGGATTDLLAPYVPPEVAGGAGYAANVATQAIPTVLGGLIGKSAGQPLAQSAGKRLMRSALKPGRQDIVSGDAAKAVQTLLDEGVNVTPGGAAKLQRAIDQLSDDVARTIESSTGTVDKQKVGSELFKLLDRVREQAVPGAATKSVESAFDEFMSHPLLKGDKIPVQLAQRMKQATQRAVRDDYGELSSASREAQKSLAYGLRKGIEEAEPGVAAPNAKQQALINALDMVEPRAAIAANRDLMGLSPAAMNPKAMAAMLADRSPLVKSILARLLYSGAGPVSTGAGAAAGGAIGENMGRSR